MDFGFFIINFGFYILDFRFKNFVFVEFSISDFFIVGNFMVLKLSMVFINNNIIIFFVWKVVLE